jgi:hypothetical protein
MTRSFIVHSSIFFVWFLSKGVLCAQTATNEIPPLSPAYPELPPTFWEQHQSTIIVAGFAVLAFAFFFLKVMLRPKAQKILPPDFVARQALAKLQNEPEDGNILSAVSQVLRRYVSERFDLPDNVPTTAEFCAVIQSNQRLGAELAETISSFLKECDVRKFSPASGLSPLNATNRALELVNRAEMRRDIAAPVPSAAMSRPENASAKSTIGKNSDDAGSGDGDTP